MLKYFDKLFVRIYRWYAGIKGEGTPALSSILIISLFQAFNAMALIFFAGGVLHGRNWVVTRLEIVVLCIVLLAFDYVRIYRVIGFENILKRYDTKESRDVKVHPAVYFIASILLLVLLRLVGFYPDIQ